MAVRTKAFSDAVRAVDPRSRLIATGQDPDHFESWNAAQLANAPAAFNALSTHFVVQTGQMVRGNPTPEFIAQAALALPVGLERQLRLMKQQLDGDAKSKGKVTIAFTEWLFAGPVKQTPMFNNHGGALCTAGMLNTLLRTSDFTTISDMTGLIEFGGVWQKKARVYGVPAYWAFRMFSTADATRLVESQVKGERYDVVDGVRRLPNIPAVPYLDVTAALNDAGDKLTLFCVNRHLSRDLRSTLQLKGFAAASARGLQLVAPDLYTVNDDANPEAVTPQPVTVQAKGGEFEYTFPSRSLTVIELARQK